MARTKQTARKPSASQEPQLKNVFVSMDPVGTSSPEAQQPVPRARAAPRPRAGLRAAPRRREALQAAAKKGPARAPVETRKPCALPNLPLVFKGVHESFPARFRGRLWHEMVMEQQGLGRGGLFARKSQFRLFESYVIWSMVYASHAALPEEVSDSSTNSDSSESDW